jgi:hypothetical protein
MYAMKEHSRHNNGEGIMRASTSNSEKKERRRIYDEIVT